MNNKLFAEKGKAKGIIPRTEEYLRRTKGLNQIPPLFTEPCIEPRGCRPRLLISHVGGTELSKKQVVYMIPS